VNAQLQHTCPRLPNGVAIYELAPEQAGCWILQVFREAGAEDLEENHRLEELGDLMNSTSVGIVYCPYCGTKLSEELWEDGPTFWRLE